MAEKTQYLGIQIDESRSDEFEEYSKYLIQQYYARPNETIQQAFARAAVCWSSNPEHAQRLYDYASKGWFMFASPVFSNAVLPGEKPNSLPISCFESETLVNTNEGQKKIVDIKIGDKVLTKSGKYHEVINTKESKSSDCYQLSFNGEDYIVTGNHLILTQSHGWVRVDELDSKLHTLQYIPKME